jgi:hypothetical protein
MTAFNHNEETAMHHHTQRRGLGRRVAMVLAASVLLLTPTSAEAGEYQQHFCDSGAGDRSANAWYGVGAAKPNDGCNPSAGFPWNGVYYNSSSLPLNGFAGLRADSPPGARYKSLSLNLRVPYQAQNRRTFVESNGAYAFSWWNGWGGTQSYNPDGNYITMQLSDSGYFVVGQACHGSGSAGCQSGDFYFSGAAATLTDTTPPNVTADTGTDLFNPDRTVFRGLIYGEVDITDNGHGPATGAYQVDNSNIPGGSANWTGSCNYRLSNPCASRLNWANLVNTWLYADGVHTVRVAATDGVGQGAYAERTVVFDNTPPVLDGIAPFHGESHTGSGARFPVHATDATSSVTRLEAAIDGGGWQKLADGGDGAVEVDGPGMHTVSVRAVDAAGNTSAEQVSTFTIVAPPENDGIETTQDGPLPGPPGPGDEIKCNVGGPWSDGTTFTYRWLRDGVVIDGATAQTYVIVPEDAGRSLVCKFTATNPLGETTDETDPVDVGTEPCFGKVAPTDPCGDNDNDGEPNETDPDDDGDGVPDGEDPAPLDPRIPGPGGGGGGGAGGSGVAVTGAPARSGEAVAALGPPNNGVNASEKAKITVEGTRRRNVAFGRRIATVAYLRDENGRPITGAQVTVLERMNVPGASWVPARAPIVSDAQGRLRWVIPAKFSRTIRYAYKANLANADFQSTSDVVLTVYSRSTLKPSRKVARNGQTVVFRGRLMSKPIPKGGVLIDLQARVGPRWQTFKTTRAKTAGKWAVKYRFTSTRGVRTYAFRARVRQDSGYPYAISKTRAVRVKVIG